MFILRFILIINVYFARAPITKVVYISLLHIWHKDTTDWQRRCERRLLFLSHLLKSVYFASAPWHWQWTFNLCCLKRLYTSLVHPWHVAWLTNNKVYISLPWQISRLTLQKSVYVAIAPCHRDIVKCARRCECKLFSLPHLLKNVHFASEASAVRLFQLKSVYSL